MFRDCVSVNYKIRNVTPEDLGSSKEERETLAEMPRVPDALPAPQSLGGLLKHMQDDESMTSLAERTAETNEDIEERTALANAISELDEATEETAEQSIELDE